jgi:hypothetical protein
VPPNGLIEFHFDVSLSTHQKPVKSKNRPEQQGRSTLTVLFKATSLAHRNRALARIQGTLALSREVAGLDYASHS